MKLASVAGAEEQRLPTLRAGLGRRRIEGVGPPGRCRDATDTAPPVAARRPRTAGRTEAASPARPRTSERAAARHPPRPGGRIGAGRIGAGGPRRGGRLLEEGRGHGGHRREATSPLAWEPRWRMLRTVVAPQCGASAAEAPIVRAERVGAEEAPHRLEREPVAEPAVGVHGLLHRHQPPVMGRVERLRRALLALGPVEEVQVRRPVDVGRQRGANAVEVRPGPCPPWRRRA